MTQCEFVVIFIIENVEEVTIKGMDVLDFGEVIEDVGESLVNGVLAEFYLSG